MATKIIYGTAWKQEKTKEYVINAILHGFRAVDTACQRKHYREDLVGDALQTLYDKDKIQREDIFLQTKFTSVDGQDLNQSMPYNPLDSVTQQITSSFQTSLNNLHTTYLDSYILHSPLRTMELTLEAWRTLIHFQDQGMVKTIGLSNTYDVKILEALSSLRKVQVVQNRWYQGNDWDKEVVAYCKSNGIQYQSFWTLTGSPSLLAMPSVLALAEEAECTPQQAVYRTAQMLGITPLCGTTNEAHMSEAVVVDKIQLRDGKDLAAVMEAVRAHTN